MHCQPRFPVEVMKLFLRAQRETYDMTEHSKIDDENITSTFGSLSCSVSKAFLRKGSSDITYQFSHHKWHSLLTLAWITDFLSLII